MKWGDLGILINPNIVLDQFVISKLEVPTKVKIRTDINSLEFTLTPGSEFKFTVVLKQKDSCVTIVKSPELKDYSEIVPELHDTIVFKVNKFNTNYVSTLLNGIDKLTLNFDTGTSDLVLMDAILKDIIKSKILLYEFGQIRIGERTYNR